MSGTNISRRDFLKLGSAGLLGLAFSELGLESALADAAAPTLGRVAYPSVAIYDRASLNGQKIKDYPRDAVLNITAQVTGEDQKAYNPTWYRIGSEGYAYSGAIQPVQFSYNDPLDSVPATGLLGEITVPYADAYWAPDYHAKRAYRLYYETTHWVQGILVGLDNNIYYDLYDDRLKVSYYAPAWGIRAVPADELTPLSTNVPPEKKFIEVSLSGQQMVAYEDGAPVFTARVSTGRRWNPTPTGTFSTFHKRATRHMVGGDLAAPAYDLPGVPWVMFVVGGVSFHGTYWHNDYGTQHSAGCINMTAKDAKWLFRWAMPVLAPDKRWLYRPGEGTGVRVGATFKFLEEEKP